MSAATSLPSLDLKKKWKKRFLVKSNLNENFSKSMTCLSASYDEFGSNKATQGELWSASKKLLRSKSSDLSSGDLERLTHYERYINQLVAKTDPNHPHFLHLSSSSKRAKELLNMSPYLPEEQKKLKKSKKSINWPFKKASIKSDNYVDKESGSVGGHLTNSRRNGAVYVCSKIFGQPLSTYLNGDTLLPPISNLLTQLYLKGPFTVGIFRKSANARVCRELKIKLDENPNASLEDFPVMVIASVFKEFLRCLPDCILDSKLYQTWIYAVNMDNNLECRERISDLLKKLPNENLVVLRHILCVLWHIAKRSGENKMCPVNLGVCIGPSLLNNKETLSVSNCEEISKQVPKLVAYLIDHCPELLGDNTLRLFSNISEKDASKQDSGAEESDSLKSLHDGSGFHLSGSGNRRDDSSIDSIEKAVMDDVRNQNPLQLKPDASEFGNKMSLSNLSRDSGLTLSDTQLYSPEEEGEEEEEEEEEEEDEDEEDAEESECSDTSDGLINSRLLPHLTKSVPHLNSAGLENAINVTFSYGRSVGVSIDGSCHDVVRKRRHQDTNAKHKHNPFNCLIGGYNRNQGRIPEISTPHHLPIQYSKSYSSGINHDAVDVGQDKPIENDLPKNVSRYRHKRPPLSAILKTSNNFNSGYHSACPALSLRKSTSEESVRLSYDSENVINEPISLPYHVNRPKDEVDHGRKPSPTKPCHFSSHSDLQPENYECNSPEVESLPHLHISSICSSGARRVESVCSSSSETTSQRSSASKRSTSSVAGARNNPLSISPPSYQETMSRKEIFARIQNHPLASRRISSTSPVSSAQIFEESVRVYNEDLQKGSNVFLRAVPVRVKAAGCNYNESESTASQVRKQPLCRLSSERKMTSVVDIAPSKRPLRFCNSVKIKDSHEYKQNGVTIEERCAKDLTDDWRKEIHWSVAQLRALFNEHASKPDRELMKQSNKPVSVMVTSSPGGPAVVSATAAGGDKKGSSVEHYSSEENRFNGCHAVNKENCVTVIHVSQVSNSVKGNNNNNSNNCPTVVSVHRRSDSVVSSEEESYV